MKIVVTEENFEEALSRMQCICNKYKMLRNYRVFNEDMSEKKQYRHNMFMVETKLKKKKNGKYKTKKVLIANNSFIHVTKHPFRQEYEEGSLNTDDLKIYMESRCLIHLDMNVYSALVVHEGDIIKLLPFRLGFIIWTNDKLINPGKLTIYREMFIPDIIRGKIFDLAYEIQKREKDTDEYDEMLEEIEYKGDNYYE